MIALILHACYRLANLGMEDAFQCVIAAACLVVTAVVQAEVALLFLVAGALGVLYYGTPLRSRLPHLRERPGHRALPGEGTRPADRLAE